ncbi:MAG: AfsR/SARP family transcriptional regulator, partial [Sciscionella sp.]
VGVGAEAADMNPQRIRAHPTGTAARAAVEEILGDAVASIDRANQTGTDTVSGRAGQEGEDLWLGRLLLIAPDALAGSAPAGENGQDGSEGLDGQGLLDQLLTLVRAHPGHVGTAVVMEEGNRADRTSGSGVGIELDAAGQLRIPAVGLELTGVGLTAEETRGCATLLAHSRAAPDLPTATAADTGRLGARGSTSSVDGADSVDGEYGVGVTDAAPGAAAGWHAYADQAGSLRAEHTHARATPAEDLDEPASRVLERPDQDYLAAAATTAEDLAALDPHVPTRIRAELEDADPDLDADVTDWFAQTCARPRLAVLGPMAARTRGSALAVADRKQYFTSALAYLACHPNGVTPDQAATALAISPGRMAAVMSTLRYWLGPNPITGEKNPPDARKSRAARARGGAYYQVDELLWDADLFGRLCARGKARGPDGVEDLTTALRLVTGEPFAGFDAPWLCEGDRIDLRLRGAVVDLAHLLTVQALHADDLDRATSAVETALRVAPHDEVPLLDLTVLRDAEGHRSEAERIVAEELRNYWADDEPPADLSTRTDELLRRWAAAAAAS